MFIDPKQGILLLLLFAAAMIGISYVLRKKEILTSDGFLLANRNVSVWRGALSIAVSWMWAPAIFVAAMQAYTKGLAGAFWFTVPNILCFFLFAVVAVKLRQQMPEGYTLPEFMSERFGKNVRVHVMYLIIFFGYQLGAIVMNGLAGGLLLHSLTGMSVQLAIVLMSGTALAYALLSGLKASVLTDVFQMILILGLCLFLIPWTVQSAGGWQLVLDGFGGVSGEFSSLFNPAIAYSFGIALTISFFSQPLGDQMFFQRSFALRKERIKKTFMLGGLVFGAVPILLSLLGFLAASPLIQAQMTVTDPQMIAPLMIAQFLPGWALMLFIIMAFAGLCSTLDSAYCAMSSLGSIDVYKRYINPSPTDNNLLSVSRKVMLLMAVIGTGIALFEPKLLWIIMILGALASAGFIPTILSLFWQRTKKEGVFWGILFSIVIGLPLSIYANVNEHTDLIVLASVLSVGVSGVVCFLVSVFVNKTQTEIKIEN